MRRSTLIAILLAGAGGLCVALVALGGLIVAIGGESVSSEWQQPTTPTTAGLERLRGAQHSPVFWFGPGTGFGPGPDFRDDDPYGPATDRWKLTQVANEEPSDELGDGRSLVFTYGLYCAELDLGSGLTCQNRGRVSNAERTAQSFRSPRRSCWTRVGLAWLINCGSASDEVDGPRLLTGDRVVRFTYPLDRDPYYARPWRQTIGLLRRFDAPDAGDGIAGLTAPSPATRAQYEALGPKARAALPPALRP